MTPSAWRKGAPWKVQGEEAVQCLRTLSGGCGLDVDLVHYGYGHMLDFSSTLENSLKVASAGSKDGGAGSQPEELCLVCQDLSTGYHYGVPSCNGCKTFFRRTIMKKQTFVCQYDGNCPVDKSIRCACRHCRFEKCLQVGMDRNAIQQNRDPIGYTKRTRRYPLVVRRVDGSNTPSSSGAAATAASSSLGSSDESSPRDAASSAEAQAEDEALAKLVAVERDCEHLRTADLHLEKSLLEAVLAPSNLYDQAYLNEHKVAVYTYSSLRPAQQSDYQWWHEQDWIIMIEWAKTLPVYSLLPTTDKLALLRHSAITYPSLLQCFYTPDKGPDTIVFPNGAYFDRTPEPARPLGFNKKKYQMLDQLLLPLRKLAIDQTEFAAFKAIFFLNPDADEVSLASKALLSDGRSGITNALYRYMVKKDPLEAADRFGKLLLLGTVLATMAVEMKEAVVVADFFDQIRFSPFAKQLLFGIKNEAS